MRCLDLGDQPVSHASNKPNKHNPHEERNIPEISPQINNLPSTQSNQHPHRAERKPLDPLVGALVGIAQLLLPRPQVLHLADNLGHHLLHAAEIRLDGLELLVDLDAGPVAGVGADVDVELDGAVRVGDAFCAMLDTMPADWE